MRLRTSRESKTAAEPRRGRNLCALCGFQLLHETDLITCEHHSRLIEEVILRHEDNNDERLKVVTLKDDII